VTILLCLWTLGLLLWTIVLMIASMTWRRRHVLLTMERMRWLSRCERAQRDKL
jgi:hypothetical protein